MEKGGSVEIKKGDYILKIPINFKVFNKLGMFIASYK